MDLQERDGIPTNTCCSQGIWYAKLLLCIVPEDTPRPHKGRPFGRCRRGGTKGEKTPDVFRKPVVFIR